MKILIVVPTYNEIDNIEKLLIKIFKQAAGLNVLIVDDNSPDKTYELVKRLVKSKYKGRLFLIKREDKLGLGTAYIAGFKWAIERKYDYIFEMDADFSHNPEYIPVFLKALKNNDLVLGSRYISGGGVKGWGALRKFISKGGSLYSKFFLGLPFNDLTGGYKGFRREVLERINLDDVKSNGYSFQIELTYRTYLNGFNIKEIPIVFEDRTRGKSKMSRSIFLEAVFLVPWMRFNKHKFAD